MTGYEIPVIHSYIRQSSLLGRIPLSITLESVFCEIVFDTLYGWICDNLISNKSGNFTEAITKCYYLFIFFIFYCYYKPIQSIGLAIKCIEWEINSNHVRKCLRSIMYAAMTWNWAECVISGGDGTSTLETTLTISDSLYYY